MDSFHSSEFEIIFLQERDGNDSCFAFQHPLILIKKSKHFAIFFFFLQDTKDFSTSMMKIPAKKIDDNKIDNELPSISLQDVWHSFAHISWISELNQVTLLRFFHPHSLFFDCFMRFDSSISLYLFVEKYKIVPLSFNMSARDGFGSEILRGVRQL